MDKSSRLWERFEDAAHDNAQQMTSIANDAITALEAAESRIAELEREHENLRPVGVMSEKAYPMVFVVGKHSTAATVVGILRRASISQEPTNDQI